ncbi:MAG: glycosyltransferase family 2 protein [Patescibacteria group bacterium]
MKLSAIILTKNAQDKLEECLRSVRGWVDEIVILDTGSVDKTLDIARKYGARIRKSKGKDYAAWRNEAAKLARGEWLFYIDHDERVSEELKLEIQRVTSHESRVTYSAYDIPRKNYVFGKWLKHGGWWPDKVLRLIKKNALVKWEGEVHEQPIVNGTVGSLKNALIHLKEDNLSDMVEKTNRYSVYEAKLLFKANHPQMSWWRFISVMARELWDRFVVKLGFLDGPEGIIYCAYQGYSRFVTYAKLWELQHQKDRN